MSRPNYIRGDRLSRTARSQVLARYIYRWTTDNPHRAQAWGKLKPSSHPRIPLVTDDEWLRDHSFAVRADGKLDERVRHAAPAFFAETETAA